MSEYGFCLTRIFPYKDKIFDSTKSWILPILSNMFYLKEANTKIEKCIEYTRMIACIKKLQRDAKINIIKSSQRKICQNTGFV